MKKAIAYTSHVSLDYCDKDLCCDEQSERIEKYCRDNDIKLTEVVREINCDTDLMNRPGVQYLLKKCSQVDYVIVERPWCIGRRSSVLDEFLDSLDRAKVQLLCATHLWDCASQYVRRYHYRNVPLNKDKSHADKKAS